MGLHRLKKSTPCQNSALLEEMQTTMTMCENATPPLHPPTLNSGIIHFNLYKYILVPQCFALCAATCLPWHHAIKEHFFRITITESFSGPCQWSTRPSFSSSAASVPRQRAAVVRAVLLGVNSYMKTTSKPSCGSRLMKGASQPLCCLLWCASRADRLKATLEMYSVATRH